MRPTFSRPRGATALALLGTASFLTIAGTAAALAQTQEAVEEVLVTGSLIRGAAAVGVPVTALSDQDFKETGALTISDLLRSVPSVTVSATNMVVGSGGVIEHPETVKFHNISTAKGSEAVMLIDGMRFPVQGHESAYIDPSIIPQLAIDHLDLLADGASATYGSDAVAGVINVILKRGFEGAISQVRYARSWDLGGPNYQASQLYGTKWNSGDVTLSYEWYHEDSVRGPGPAYFTLNFEPYGFDDRTLIGDAMPGVVSTGALVAVPALAALGFTANNGTRACANCYSIPAGVGWNYGDTPAHTNPTDPGSAPTTSWTTLLANAGVKNLRNAYANADILPSEDHNSATAVFDQDLIYGIKFFGEGFYSNRRSVEQWVTGASPAVNQPLRAQVVPTTNPYYPAGAPAGLRISYNLGPEHDTRVNSGELSERYAYGFTSDLPYDWHARLYSAMNQDQNFAHVTNMDNLNMVSAALGNTVASVAANGSTPGQAAFTKPANIPYLNLFCDATQFRCNSQATLDYISAYRFYDEKWQLAETGLNLDGPVTELPGGTVRAAVGANAISSHYFYAEHSNFNTVNTSVPVVAPDTEKRATWAVFGQVNVPLIGEMNKLPLIEAFNVEVSYRYDRYYDFGGVTTPKLAATWNVGYGLSLRGTLGKSFRAPGFGEYSAIASVMIQPVNTGAGAITNTVSLNCPAVPGLSGSGANAGSLNAYLNPTCSGASALLNPAGVVVTGGSGGAVAIRSGQVLGPEKAKNWALGFNLRPTGFLSGLDIDVTQYHIRIDNLITNNSGGVNINDPLAKICTAPGPGCLYLVRANPNLPITDPSNAAFLALVNAVVLAPRSVAAPSGISNIQFINDTAITNIGWREIGGIDFDARYDFDLGDWGAWNAGVTGNFKLEDKYSRFWERLPLVRL